MVGAICRRDILSHPVVTIRCFGWRVFLRALVAGQQQTFLSLLVQASALQPAADDLPDLIERCIGLELSAKRTYESLAQRFAQPHGAKEFFETLACQEQDQADLLDLCRTVTGRGQWDPKYFDQWRDAVPRLERQMQEAETWAESLGGPSDALRLVIQIESSEVNHVYLGIVAACDSAFVRKVRAFREAGLKHVAYICRKIPDMEPEFQDVCRKLYDEYSRAVAGD